MSAVRFSAISGDKTDRPYLKQHDVRLSNFEKLSRSSLDHSTLQLTACIQSPEQQRNNNQRRLYSVLPACCWMFEHRTWTRSSFERAGDGREAFYFKEPMTTQRSRKPHCALLIGRELAITCGFTAQVRRLPRRWRPRTKAYNTVSQFKKSEMLIARHSTNAPGGDILMWR